MTNLALTPTTIRQSTKSRYSHAVRDAKEIQQLLLSDMRNKKTSPAVRASLARSWVYVQQMMQELRGVPKPGQLRPDLDPTQMMKALKRARARGSVMDVAGILERPMERPMAALEDKEPTEPKPTEPKPTEPKPTEPKEPVKPTSA